VFRTLPDGGALALVVLGINRFKEVNDSLGHLAGDDLLRTTAGRLAAFIRPGDLLARVGGDEFAILSTSPPVTLEIDSELAKLVDPAAAGEAAPAQASLHAAAANGEPAAVDPVEDALRRARRLADELAVPTEIAGMQVAAEVSIGVAVALSGDGDLTELLRRANIAMSRAKHGAGPVAAFDVDDKQSGEAGLERLAVVVEMREALNVDDQLRLEVQPAIDLRTKLPTSVEVLVRWDHPRRGRLAPHEFIDVVDRSELVIPFTRYVLEHALRLARDWRRAGVAAPVAVNLSPRSLADTTLPSDVATLLARYGVEPSMLVLEITEAAMVTGQEVAAVLSDLRGQGVQLALDDYGTGYSSLTFLRQVEVDEVKVDGSFVADMAGSLAAAAIIRTTVDLGRRLGIRVVAEGVETVEQVDALVDLGCRAAQGWYFARPVPAGESTALLRRLVSAAQR
jgi:diguanylate cyclase